MTQIQGRDFAAHNSLSRQSTVLRMVGLVEENKATLVGYSLLDRLVCDIPL